jgi:hypothetical protein
MTDRKAALTLCRAAALLLVLLSAAMAAPAAKAQSPVTVRNARLGLAHVDLMDLHQVRLPDRPPEAVDALAREDITDRYDHAVASGAVWHRWSLYWDLIDRGGTFDWSVADGIVGRDVGRNLSTLGVLQGAPPGVRHLQGAPADIDRPIFRAKTGGLTDDPADAESINPANTWARFVAATIERYRPGGTLAKEKGWMPGAGVSHWEIGNEPNLPHFWHGSPAEFVRYLEVAYLAAKWVDPNSVIVHGGIANEANAGPWYSQFADALAARAASSPLPRRHNYYFDKAAWHWYTQPRNVTVRPDQARRILTSRGLPAKPIWVTEFGVPVWSEYPGPCWDPASPGRVTAAEQSAFVWQSIAAGLSDGVEVMIYFQLYDDCGNGIESYDAFGLVRNHAANQCWTSPAGHACWSFDPNLAGTTRPAYDAFRTIARELAAATPVERTIGRGWRKSVFSRPSSGDRVTVAWNTTGRDRFVDLPASADSATLFELDGAGGVRTTAVRAASGRYRVFLPGATNRNGFSGRAMASGRPIILVERTGWAAFGGSKSSADVTPPDAALVGALPEVSEPRFDLTILGSDAQSSLDAFQLFYSMGAPPSDPSGWTRFGNVLPWPGKPQVGMITLPFVGIPGQTYFFTVQVADEHGNWTELPPYAHAFTRIKDYPATSKDDATKVEPISAQGGPTAR